MLGLLGSLLGSVSSGVMGMMGQNSANQEMEKLSATRYQTASADMKAAGLNPMMMFGSGGPAPMPPIQNTMSAPAVAVGSAVASATQQAVASKTIDNLVAQNADIAASVALKDGQLRNIVAGLPSTAAKSTLDKLNADAISAIPPKTSFPVIQAGFGADATKNVPVIGGALGAGAVSAGALIDQLRAKSDTVPSNSISGPVANSAKSVVIPESGVRPSDPRGWKDWILGNKDQSRNLTTARHGGWAVTN